MSRLACLTLASLFTAIGCNQLLPASMASGVVAPNPLGGQPVKWSQKSDGLPFEGEKACSTWPIQDELTATATETEICAKGHFYKVREAKFGDPGTYSLRVESDGSGDPSTAGDKGIVSGPARKIGQCVDRGMEKSVWEEPFDGCVPNKGALGSAALTSRSTYLQIGAARWKFRSGEPSEAAAKSAPPK